MGSTPISSIMSSLGRRTPNDFDHVEKYPYSAVAPPTLDEVNFIFRLPAWHWSHDQGHQGACEGHGNSMMMSLLNKKRYNPFWLWNEAKKIDEWPDTNPGDDNGTSGRATCDILRTLGHSKWQEDQSNIEDGITANRWATTIDEMRTALGWRIPIAIGVNWYPDFDNPVKKSGGYFIGQSALTQPRGGHCVCIYGASDKRQAFRVKNSWGKNYPLVWLPYTTMQTLLDQEGEACLITDR